MDVSLTEFVSVGSAIAASSFAIAKMVARRIGIVEKTFSDAIHKLNDNLVRIDKRLAVNSAIIDRFMVSKGELGYGHNRDREDDSSPAKFRY